MDQLQQIIEQWGVYAVFALCTVEGDITLLISGAMASAGFFGEYSFLRVFVAGTLGGMAGDCFGYFVGRIFHQKAQHYRFYKMAQPRIERLIDKFGSFAIIISKYIYGIRAAMCVFYGIGKMPLHRFLIIDAISCGLWVLILSGLGYFFSGAISKIIGNFEQVGIALLFLILFAVIAIYAVERFWISERVEEADPETLLKLEETFHHIEDAAQEKFHDLSERLHLTREPNRPDENAEPPEKSDADPPPASRSAKK